MGNCGVITRSNTGLQLKKQAAAAEEEEEAAAEAAAEAAEAAAARFSFLREKVRL